MHVQLVRGNNNENMDITGGTGIGIGKHILNELSNDSTTAPSPRKRSKLDRITLPLSSADENVQPTAQPHIPFASMQANNNGDLSGASTSKDGATPIGSIATGAMLIKHGHVSAMNGLNDSSLMNITDPSISEPAAVDDTFKPIDQVRKSKRSHNKTDFFSSDNYAAPPPDGRAIVNTSLIKVATQNQLRGRSPLANVANKQNGTSAEIEAQQRRNMAVVADNGFHLYQKKAPQTYYGEDNFNKLSDEIIFNIFQFLPKKALIRCSLVSRRFNAVSMDEWLWIRMDLSMRQIRPGALGRVVSRGICILRAAQTKIAAPIFLPCDVSDEYTSKLQFLDLSMADISKDGLLDLLRRCRQLKKLSLEHVALNHEICVQIAENKELEGLNLTMCEGIDARCLRLMCSALQKLKALNISWTHMDSECVSAVVDHIPVNLIRLNVSGCRKSMTDEYLTKLVTRCPQMVELDLSDCTLLTSEAIKIVCKLRKLEYLSLSRCYNISVGSYLTISELTSSLNFLDIFGVLSDQAITMLQTSFPSIGINKYIHSSVARPTVGTRRTSIWGLRTRD